MKLTVTIILLATIFTSSAQSDSLKLSRVFHFDQLKPETKNGITRRQLLEERGSHLDYLEIHTTTLPSGKSPHAPHSHLDTEELIIIKEGSLKVQIGDTIKTLGAGSIALALPGDSHGFVNVGTGDATYYVIKYRSIEGLNEMRSKASGGSMIVNWNVVPYKERPKGGVRQFFERKTGMLNRLEMHVTTLNEGIKSHEPHRHVAAEIMLVVEGEVEMQIGENFHVAKKGDLVLIQSGVLHAPRNVGKGQATYFAIQWN